MKRTIEIKGEYAFLDRLCLGFLAEPLMNEFFKLGSGFYEVEIEKSFWGKYKMKIGIRGDFFHIHSRLFGWCYHGPVCAERFPNIFFPLEHKKRYNITSTKIMDPD